MIDKLDQYKLDFDDLIEVFPSALYVIKDYKIIDCNSAALQLFGYEKKVEVIGLGPYELSPELQPDGRYSNEKGKDIVDKALISEKPIEFQWTHLKKNGHSFVTDIRITNRNGLLFAVIFDIDHQEKIKNQLAEKNKIYQLLFENNKSVMLLINSMTGRIVKVNRATIEYYGYSEEELLSMKIAEINTLSEKEVKEEMIRAKKEDRNCFEFTHRLANGELRDVEVHSFPIEIDNESLLFSIIHDVSEIRSQKLMFDTLFFDSPDAVAILNKDQKIVNINRNFTNLFQYYLEDVKDGHIAEFVSTIDSEKQVVRNIQLLYQGEIIKQEGIRRRKDGKLLYVEIICYPIVSHNAIVGAYIIYLDITAKKASERQLNTFRKILEYSSEGLILTDADGNITWVNNAFIKITGYSLIDVIGKKTNILKSGYYEDSFYRDMWKELQTKGEWRGEITNISKRGLKIRVLLTIRGITDENNKTTHYVGSYRKL
ncbi:PAS domain-containing protein [Alkaliphilus serpentinus]|uniref:PAS domain S-box protein n=1 Tax=Alkaliphilus serpentinus TaxID=1482731 RepID=A0A833HRH4_9FIRM|nr:PAS domain-containing protein [Alkaliphilus serpentinus]KAB3533229.1 PAS domain S-box protein [Alkaliphilus serpentinus]